MAGAPCFSALAAYRTGAGLVKVMTAEENRGIMQQLLPEALLFTYDTVWACRNPEEFKDRIRSQVQWADVIVLGPGLGQEEYAKALVETVLSDAYVPIVMDADAINLAAGHSYLKGYFTENIILTPHILEFSRLTGKEPGEIKADPVGCARELSDQYGVTCVLKDAATVTARKDGKVFVNTSGSPALAKGGSGDVLAGVIAGLLAIGMDDCEAASLGVYVHGLAGQAAEERFGAHSVLARETADCLGKIINFGEAVRLGGGPEGGGEGSGPAGQSPGRAGAGTGGPPHPPGGSPPGRGACCPAAAQPAAGGGGYPVLSCREGTVGAPAREETGMTQGCWKGVPFQWP